MNTYAIMLLTYHRLDYAMETLRSVLRYAHTDDQLRVHIASDGDEPWYIDMLTELVANERPEAAVGLTVSNSQRQGYGANFNLGTQTVHGYATHVLPLEDDWRLTRDLDLDLFAGALDELQAGCIRLGYLGYTQPLRGEFAQSYGRHWLRLDPASAEPHVFAGHPRLETVAWERSVGPWPEGLQPGETEFAVAHLPAARTGVVWPIQEVKPYGDLFVHIGTVRSW